MNPENQAEARLLRAAQKAYGSIRFYEALYRESPQRVEQIPWISHANYHQAQGLLDCIVDREQVIGTLPPYHRHGRKFPYNIVESEDDSERRHERLVRAFRHLGALDPNVCRKFLLITDDACGPFCCQMTTSLAWERQQASMAYHAGSLVNLEDDIASYDPDVVVLVSSRLRSSDLSLKGRQLVTLCHVDTLPAETGPEPLLLACDELGVVASKAAGERAFSYDGETLLLERCARSGRVSVTTLQFTCFPFIRYNLGVSLEFSPYEHAAAS